MTAPDPAREAIEREAEREGNPPWHVELFSARDQIASDRRCEKLSSCRFSSQIGRGCECMQSAMRRVIPGYEAIEHEAEARVVQWLRSKAWFYDEVQRWREMAELHERLADAIERREHLETDHG